MINANELRIGNWILHKGLFAQVGAIEAVGNGACDGWTFEGHRFYSKEIEPIPIMPHILSAAGFEGHKEVGGKIKFYCSKRIATKVPPIYWIARDNWSLEGLPNPVHSMKYLHQLQNIFFAITGEELPINLTEPATH